MRKKSYVLMIEARYERCPFEHSQGNHHARRYGDSVTTTSQARDADLTINPLQVEVPLIGGLFGTV
jgi:hypothetical protein